MKSLLIICLPFMVLSCNLVQWNQNRLDKKFTRKGIEEKYLEKDGHNVHYWTGGEGETVVLIHGFGADGQMTWNESIQDLIKDHHLIVPDLLWFGESRSSKNPELESQVDAILGVLEHENVSKCHVVGISYGGFVSLGLVAAKPGLVSKLCIVDSPGITYNIDLLDTLCEKANVKEVQEIFVVREPAGVQRLLDLAFYRPRKVPRGVLNDTYALYFSRNQNEQYQLIESLPKEKERLTVQDLRDVPEILIIWGEQDIVFPLSEGQKFADAVGAEIKIVPKAGHAVNLENFKVFERHLRSFLDN